MMSLFTVGSMELLPKGNVLFCGNIDTIINDACVDFGIGGKGDILF